MADPPGLGRWERQADPLLPIPVEDFLEHLTILVCVQGLGWSPLMHMRREARRPGGQAARRGALELQAALCPWLTIKGFFLSHLLSAHPEAPDHV